MFPLLVLIAAQALPYESFLTGNATDAQTRTRPGYVLAGGGKDQDEAMKWLLDRSGGGDIVVLRASGSDGYNKYLFELGKVDSVESIVFKEPEAAMHPYVLERIRNAEALFFAGGDQWRYVNFWRGTPVQAEIQRAIERGVPVGGTSAGLAILGQWSFSAKFDTVHSPEAMADPFHKAVQLERDFLAVPNLAATITDSHFAARSRQGRLIAFLARMKMAGVEDPRGIGIDERTALLLEADGRARVVGEGEVWFYRPGGAPELCEPAKPLQYLGVAVYRVNRNGAFDLNTWEGSNGAVSMADVENGKLISR